MYDIVIKAIKIIISIIMMFFMGIFNFPKVVIKYYYIWYILIWKYPYELVKSTYKIVASIIKEE